MQKMANGSELTKADALDIRKLNTPAVRLSLQRTVVFWRDYDTAC